LVVLGCICCFLALWIIIVKNRYEYVCRLITNWRNWRYCNLPMCVICMEYVLLNYLFFVLFVCFTVTLEWKH